jgi:hypothetical protein
MAYAEALRASSEANQLKDLMDKVASKCTELITLALATNATTETNIQMPSNIGSKQYWLLLRNDSAKTWLSGGFGGAPIEGMDLRVYIPQEASATGQYIGGYGAAHLRCSLDADILQVELDSSQGE